MGDATGGLYAFEGTSGRLLWEKHRLHNRGLLSMVVYPDGQRLVTGGQDGCLSVQNLQDGKEILSIDLGKVIEHLALSPNGQRLAASFIASDCSF